MKYALNSPICWVYKTNCVVLFLFITTNLFGTTNTENTDWQLSSTGKTEISVNGHQVAEWLDASVLLVDDKSVDFDDIKVTKDDQSSLVSNIRDISQLNEWTNYSKVHNGSIWRRRLTYINKSQQIQDITNAVFRFRVKAVEQPWTPYSLWVAKVSGNRHAIIGYWTNSEFHKIKSKNKIGDCQVDIQVETGWRLKPGQQAVLGEAIFALRDNVEGKSFGDTATWWYQNVLRLKPPIYPEWLRGSVLYEASAAGHLESRFSDTGGFDAFARQVPYLADLGVNFVWLNAVHKHKDRSPDIGWNHYAPMDFTKIDPVLGGDEGLKRLMNTFDSNGIKVIGGVVPHGHQSIQATKLKEWASRNSDGSLVGAWGALCIDYACPQWQDVVAATAAQLASFGMQGVRIDVTDPMGMNWTSPRTNHASYSKLGGALELQKRIYEEMHKAGISIPLLIPESCHDRPEYSELPALGYGISYIFKLHDIVNAHRTSPSKLNSEITRTIKDTLWSKPPGFLLIWALNNHDMLNSHCRMQLRFGSGMFRSLYSICVALPGIPMLYQEDEIGSYDFLKKVHWAKRRIPEFKTDYYDLDAVIMDAESSRVFTILRRSENTRSNKTIYAIALINLSGQKVNDTVVVKPFEDTSVSDTTVFDAISGKSVVMQNGEFNYELEPYGVAFMRIGTPPDEMSLDKFSGQPEVKMTSAENFHAIINEIDSEFSHGKLFSELNAGLSTVSSNNDEIKVSYKAEGPLKLTVFNSDLWKVSTQSAVLSDRTLRRHYPFPKDTGYLWKREQAWGVCFFGNVYNSVAPVGRLWQSIFEPLHSQEPIVLFYDKNGKGFSVTVNSTNADNIVLTDRSDDCPNEPFGLELRFYQKDTDLSDTTRYFGFDPAFITQSMPQNATNQPLEVELSIRPVELSEEHIIALRFQYSDIYTTQLKIGDGFCIPVEGIRINEPSTIKWQDLSCPAGSYRLKFTVKYSEKWFKSNKQKDAYIVKFNDEPLKIEWGDLDKTSGFGVLWSESVSLPNNHKFNISLSSTLEGCGVRKPFYMVRKEN